jgi:hypothetical protein
MSKPYAIADDSSCTDPDYSPESVLLKIDRINDTYRETTDALRNIHNDWLRVDYLENLLLGNPQSQEVPYQQVCHDHRNMVRSRLEKLITEIRLVVDCMRKIDEEIKAKATEQKRSALPESLNHVRL